MFIGLCNSVWVVALPYTISMSTAGGLIDKAIAGSGIYAEEECCCKKKNGSGMYLNPYMGRRYNK